MTFVEIIERLFYSFQGLKAYEKYRFISTVLRPTEYSIIQRLFNAFE